MDIAAAVQEREVSVRDVNTCSSGKIGRCDDNDGDGNNDDKL